jgi:hypothetical protein
MRIKLALEKRLTYFTGKTYMRIKLALEKADILHRENVYED